MMTSAKGSTSFQNLCCKCYKTYILNFTLGQVCFKLNKYKQIRKDVLVALSNPTYLASKKTNFSRVPEQTSLRLS